MLRIVLRQAMNNDRWSTTNILIILRSNIIVFIYNVDIDNIVILTLNIKVKHQLYLFIIWYIIHYNFS